MRKVVTVIVTVICAAFSVYAEDRPQFRVMRVTEPPKIDGVLNDEAWQSEPLPLGDWISYNPLRGGRADLRTDVRIAYDDRYIYFAFHCFDNEPDKIRTTITRRDTAFRPATSTTECMSVMSLKPT